MKLGIVGAEEAKFTEVTERAARMAIRSMLRTWHPALVISGRSPIGGVDWWAIEEAEAMCIPTREHAPRRHSWLDGYKPRNLLIAHDSDVVACITLKELPPGFLGRHFSNCYHCGTPPDDHVKSGGCWTMHQARALGKHAVLVVIDPEGTCQSRKDPIALERAPR